MSSRLQKRQPRLRSVATLFVILFLISTAFPIAASLMNQEGRVWLEAGIYDVALALLCFGLMLLLSLATPAPTEASTLQQVQRIEGYIHAIPLLLILLYFLAIPLNWEILLIGLGWRVWLLLTTLPYLVAAFQQRTPR